MLSAFSLDAWKQTRGILTSGLSENVRAELFQELGLSHFVYEDSQRCSSSKSPYIGALDNWNNGEHISFYYTFSSHYKHTFIFKASLLKEGKKYMYSY